MGLLRAEADREILSLFRSDWIGANRYPPADQVRGHVASENALTRKRPET
jgi:hypothetical protein